MNILTLSNCPLVESQGSGYVILNTAKCLESQGHRVKLVSPEEIMLFNFLKSRARIYRIMLGMAWWIVTHKIKKYDLFIFYGAESFLAVYLLKKVLRVKSPVVLHSNGLEIMVQDNLKWNNNGIIENKKWYHFDLSKYFLYCYKAVDRIITVSKSECDFAINKLGLSKDKVSFINLALPDFYFEEEPLHKKDNIITYCGRWTAHKGAPAMSEAIKVILKKYPNYKFRVIGVGEDFDIPMVFGNDLISQIELIPFVEDKKVLKDLYSESTIFLFPSLTESFGLVTAEAMYCGCALVSTSTGFANELIDEKEALKLPTADSEYIIKSLQKLIENQQFRAEIAMNGKLKVSQLTWKNYSIKLNKIIQSI